jgi:phosphoenolpyruvate synthase/pyruvate phosphate dikinase
MTQIGLPVPGFYTIACSVCNEYFSAGKVWPHGLKEENIESMVKLQKLMGKTFYNDAKLKELMGEDYAKMKIEDFIKKAGEPSVLSPLLVSVRSGAA